MEHKSLSALIENSSRYRGRHDGKEKYLTINCPNCEWHALVNTEERCYWGVFWKLLVTRTNLRKCEFYNKQSPHERKIEHHPSGILSTGIFDALGIKE